MKILQIIPNLSKGGAERLVTDIVRELATREGIEVRLVLFREEIDYDIQDIRHLVHIIPSSVQLSLWRKNKYHIAELQQFLEDFQPDIIHSHLFEAEIVSRSCCYPSAKWFSHGHSNMSVFDKDRNETFKQKLISSFERKYILDRYKDNGGSRFICISKDTETFYTKYINSIKTIFLPNAINFNRFKSKKNKEKIHIT